MKEIKNLKVNFTIHAETVENGEEIKFTCRNHNTGGTLTATCRFMDVPAECEKEARQAITIALAAALFPDNEDVQEAVDWAKKYRNDWEAGLR